LIATYYGLLAGSRVFRGRHGIGVGMFPEFWLGRVAVDTPIGRFECRGQTTDFDIINPNHEVELVRRIAHRLSLVSDGNGVFVDVGAHVGKYTVLAGRLLGTHGQVVAVEPDPSNYAALAANVALNRLDNVHALNVGCWSSDGEMVLNRQVGNLGGHSFIDDTAGDAISVPVRTLDYVLSQVGTTHVDAMKLDVQRAESEVLMGASSTLEANRRITVFFEESADSKTARSVRMLRALGFVVERLDDVNYVAERPDGV